tara:strand:- start:201 stop:599 length:399 start_codon:yes stop_codon:yes gene_type:complete
LKVTRISAITLKVKDIDVSVAFYSQIPGFQLLYVRSGPNFASFGIDDNFINLEESHNINIDWGRVILYCDNVDLINHELRDRGFNPPPPKDASWNERYFHISDPDGHEISFAQPIDSFTNKNQLLHKSNRDF